MPLIHENTDESVDFKTGKVTRSAVLVDVTVEAVEWDLHDKVRRNLGRNRTYLAAPKASTQGARVADLEQQVERLTRLTNALLKLVIAGDLLRDESADT